MNPLSTRSMAAKIAPEGNDMGESNASWPAEVAAFISAGTIDANPIFTDDLRKNGKRPCYFLGLRDLSTDLPTSLRSPCHASHRIASTAVLCPDSPDTAHGTEFSAAVDSMAKDLASRSSKA